MSYNITPRRLWEMGVINDEQLWRSTTAAERDDLVLSLVNQGLLSTDDPSYWEYYVNEVQHGPTRFDPREWSQEAQETLSWYDPYDPNYE